MSRRDKVFCICQKVEKSKPPKKYGLPTKKWFKGKKCTCVITKAGKPDDIVYGPVDLGEVPS